MRLLRKIKLIVAAGAAGGVLASYLAVSAAEVANDDKHKDDLNSYQQDVKSKWDFNWDR